MANLSNALFDMIGEAIDNKMKHEDAIKVYAPDQYIKEFCTVTFGLPRQCGNSTTMKRVANRLIAIDLSVKKIYINKDINKTHGGDGTILDFILHTPKNVDIVMLDNASYTSRMEGLINACIRSKLYRRHNFLLVLVQ